MIFKLIFKLLVVYFLCIPVYANIQNKFIVDFFTSKKVSSVVGFSCNIEQDNLLLLKEFSKISIFTALSRFHTMLEIRLLANTNYYKLGVFFDTNCYNIGDVISLFLEATNNKMYGKLHKWLIMGTDLENVLQLIDDRLFGFSTDFVIAVPNNTICYYLYDIYNAHKQQGSQLNVSFLGSWNEKTGGLMITLNEESFVRRSNFHRLVLRAAFWKNIYKPIGMTLEEYYEDYSYGSKDSQAKFAYSILRYLSELYNFSLELHETSNWIPGDPVGPIARALIDNTADLTGSPMVMGVKRTYMMTYVHQVWPFRTIFLFRNPQPSRIRLHEILKPFENDVWFIILGLVSIVIILLTINLQSEQIDTKMGKASNSFMITVGAVCQQGTHVTIDRLSTRITFLVMMIFSLLSYNYYSASIVSVRLSGQIFKINDSLIQFGKLRLTMASEWMAYLDFYLKFPDWETTYFLQNYWLKIPESDRFMTPEIAMQLVKKGGFAYHTHPNIGYPYIDRSFSNHETCELMEVHLARPVYAALGVQLNSTFTEMTRLGLTKISEVGLRRRQISITDCKKPACRQDVLSASSISIHEFAPLLILLIQGTIVGVIVFILEILIANNKCNCKLKLRTNKKDTDFLQYNKDPVYAWS